jgi:hypothetical protein
VLLLLAPLFLLVLLRNARPTIAAVRADFTA